MTVLHSVVKHLDTLPELHGEDDFSNMLNTIATTNNMAVGKVMKVCRSVITGGKVFLMHYIVTIVHIAPRVDQELPR